MIEAFDWRSIGGYLRGGITFLRAFNQAVD